MAADLVNLRALNPRLLVPVALVRVYRFAHAIPERVRVAARAVRAYALRAWPFWLATVSIPVAGLLVFRNTLHSPIMLDAQYQPVANPGDVQFEHGISLALQLGGSLLFFFLALELLRHWSRLPLSDRQRVLAAGAAALLFAIHPVSGIVVNNTGARSLLIMQTCLVAALLAYARMRRLSETSWRWTTILALLAASLLARPNLVIAPLLLLAFDVVLAGASWRDARVWQRAATAATVVVAFVLGTQIASGFALNGVLPQPDAVLTYALTQARLHLYYYLPHFWWPFSIRLLPSVEPGLISDQRVWIGLAFILASLLGAWWLARSPGRHEAWRTGQPAARRAPLFAFCIVAYWILMIPETSLWPLAETAADHRSYPGSVFFLLAACTALVRFASTRTTVTTLAGFTLYTAAISLTLNRDWSSGRELWLQSVQHGSNAVAHLNLATSIEDPTDPLVRKHLEEALRLDTGYVSAHLHLCTALVDQGNVGEGLAHCGEAVRLQPERAQTHAWLAAAYRKAGQPFDALAATTDAVRLEPENVEYHYQAAGDAQQVRDWHLSLEHATHVRARVRDYKDLRVLRGLALEMLHRQEEAVLEYRQLLQERPDHVQVNFNAGLALAALGRCHEARPYFQKTLALQPAHRDARQHFDRCGGRDD